MIERSTRVFHERRIAPGTCRVAIASAANAQAAATTSAIPTRSMPAGANHPAALNVDVVPIRERRSSTT